MRAVYSLIAGARRLRAAGIAGLTYVPCIISQARTEAEVRTVQLVENLQRADLNAVEVARGYREMAALGMTQTEIGEAVGKSQEAVSNTLRLLNLPGEVLSLIAAGDLSASHGRELLRFRDHPEIQIAIAEKSARERDGMRGTVKYLQSTPLPFADELRAEGIVQAPLVIPAESLDRSPVLVLPDSPSPAMQIAPPAMAGAKGGSAAPAARNGRPAAQDAMEADRAELEERWREQAADMDRRVLGALDRFPGTLITGPPVMAIMAAKCIGAVNGEVTRDMAREMEVPLPLGCDPSHWWNPEILDVLAALPPQRALEFGFRLVIEHELRRHMSDGHPMRLCEWLAGEVGAPWPADWEAEGQAAEAVA